MATKQFISLENLELYDSLLKNYIAAEDAKSIKTVAIDGNILKFYDVEEPVGSTAPKYAITLPTPDLSNFVERVIESSDGRALIFNEADGGGSKFEHVDGTFSYLGTNNGGANGLAAQIYAVNKDTKIGSRINVTTSGIYYTNGASSATYTAQDELATKKDIKGDANAKTVYITETAGGSGDLYSKRYGIYQGADGSAVSPVPAEKLADIDIPKDMVVESGTVGTVTTPNVPYEGAQVGDKYIDLVIANASSDHIYIPANSLVDVYTAAQGATEVQLAIDNSNVISASIVAVNGSKLVDGSVTKAKLDNGVQASLDLADSALQDSDIGDVEDSDIENLFN